MPHSSIQFPYFEHVIDYGLNSENRIGGTHYHHPKTIELLAILFLSLTVHVNKVSFFPKFNRNVKSIIVNKKPFAEFPSLLSYQNWSKWNLNDKRQVWLEKDLLSLHFNVRFSPSSLVCNVLARV